MTRQCSLIICHHHCSFTNNISSLAWLLLRFHAFFYWVNYHHTVTPLLASPDAITVFHAPAISPRLWLFSSLGHAYIIRHVIGQASAISWQAVIIMPSSMPRSRHGRQRHHTTRHSPYAYLAIMLTRRYFDGWLILLLSMLGWAIRAYTYWH